MNQPSGSRSDVIPASMPAEIGPLFGAGRTQSNDRHFRAVSQVHRLRPNSLTFWDRFDELGPKGVTQQY